MPASALHELNTAPAERAAEWLRACNASARWVEGVLAGRPYRDAESLLAAGDKIVRSLDWADVQQALETHPRIGERASGESTEAAWSQREQAAVGGSGLDTQNALREGNIAYERRFGHVFFIRASGRSAQEILAELRRRLANDEMIEQAEVTEQLAQATRLRLERLLEE
jgi:2-oxo-4-hydroxy-4-carboxy-5-ureidoimidazoline decarboxylase